jgi:ADP-heptose:LPS heptosyltransferase
LRSDVKIVRREVWARHEKPRILLLKLDHIGDFALTLDAFRLLRETWPKAEITLVCGPWNIPLAEQSGFFDNIVSCDFYPEISTDYDGDAVIAEGIMKYRSLNLGSYDLAIDFRTFEDNRMLLSYTDAKYRAGYAAAGVALDLALPSASEAGMMAHIGGRGMALAAAAAWTFGVPAGGRDTLLNGRKPVRYFDDGIVIGMSPGTRNALRSWGRERFAELARILHAEKRCRFVLIGSNAERPDTRLIAESLPDPDVVDLAGRTAIVDLPPVFAGLDLFIGGETGTTHIAALMGVPTLCIFSGVTNVNSWRPVGPKVVALHGNVPCSPCYLSHLKDCQWNLRCMDIPPARVAAEAIAMLREGAPARDDTEADRPLDIRPHEVIEFKANAAARWGYEKLGT